MSITDYNEIFREACKAILFRHYSDISEKCCELSLQITLLFFHHSTDLVSILGSFLSILMQRLP